MKRIEELKPFSREHHHSLLLSWKIRAGFSKGVEVERIKKYTDWFFPKYIESHFREEEAYIFPILGEENPMVKKALSQHRRLEKLFKDSKNPEKSLSLAEEELEKHIRFEERKLFMEIQEIATPEELEHIDKMHDKQKFQENTEDEFWK
jgi:hypothetical protein